MTSITDSSGSRAHRSCSRCGGHGNTHPVVHIEFDGWAACVDELAAPLVLACWEAGIRTQSACQDMAEAMGGPPSLTTEIDFLHPDDMQRFARLVMHGERDHVYDSMVGALDDDDADAWVWTFLPADGAPWTEEDGYDPDVAPEPVLMAAVELPQSQLTAAAERLRAGAEAAAKAVVLQPKIRKPRHRLAKMTGDGTEAFSAVCDTLCRTLWPDQYGIDPDDDDGPYGHTNSEARRVAVAIFEALGA